ncbi:hypothetical protein PRK78_006759 [Emydomyces testavorans]|uniref:DNA-directed RNA polymerase III RPC4 n=1 Tax=Emydomyces testavorans TaxID=2070801 RepID=A0AAF0DM16_9EURO|nr:hypothetical protein PRK78_006759 [Emydomyces testavorans]
MAPKAANNRRRPINIDSASPTPGSSSATSETPRPSVSTCATSTARRGPVQRLQTLKKRATSGSLVPLNPDGTTPKPTLRYQPKAVARRSKEEREAREQLEAERQRERISEATATRRTAARGDRGRGRGRGRGGAFGRITMDVGGPLGSGRGGKLKGKYDPAGAKRSGVYGLDRKSEGGSGEVSSDEGSDYGPRFSIDQINISSGSEDEGKGKAPAKAPLGGSRGLRPIRVERQEHVERIMDINTDASSSKSAELRRQAKEKAGKDDSLFVESDEEGGDGGEVEDVEMIDSVALSAEQDLQIKEEPIDADATIADNIPSKTDETTAHTEDTVSRKPKKARKKVTIKDPRSMFQTQEERQEYDRHEQDVEQLKQALGNISTTDTTANHDEDKVKSEDIKDERNGRLFLLQFPPMTPNLMTSSTDQDPCNTTIAVDGTSSTKAPETIAVKQENGTTTRVPLSGPTSLPIPSKSPFSLPLITATNPHLPSGRVGKLEIRKSGRATIDWGGISLELSKGSDVDFLQDAVVAPESKTGDSNGSGNRMWAMSQVSGKFVVTPDWDKLLGE